MSPSGMSGNPVLKDVICGNLQNRELYLISNWKTKIKLLVQIPKLIKHRVMIICVIAFNENVSSIVFQKNSLFFSYICLLKNMYSYDLPFTDISLI